MSLKISFLNILILSSADKNVEWITVCLVTGCIITAPLRWVYSVYLAYKCSKYQRRDSSQHVKYLKVSLMALYKGRTSKRVKET